MDDPLSSQKAASFLPALIELNYRHMLNEGMLDEKRKAFFVDIRLKGFWERIGKYLRSVEYPGFTLHASGYLIDCFLTPLWFYGETGTRERPTMKAERLDRQRKADKLRKSAADHAKQLSTILQQLEELQSDNPETILLMGLISPLIGDLKHWDLSADVNYIPTSRAIDSLKESFREFPDTDELFSDLPGMCSNKSSWRDWFRQVNHHLMHLLTMYPGELNIREVDWVNLVHVLIDETISRSSVSAELRRWPELRKQFLATDDLEKLPRQHYILF